MARRQNRIVFSIVALLSVSVLFSCSFDSVENRYILAEKLWQDGKYSASVNEFEKVIKRDPRGELGKRSLFRSAMTQTLFLGEHEDALLKFKRYVKLNQPVQYWAAKKQIGSILFESLKKYDGAIEHYQALIKERPRSDDVPEFLYRVARSYFLKWEFESAIQHFQKLVRSHPNTSWGERGAYEIGLTYYTSGEQQPNGEGPGSATYKKAIKAYRKFIRRYPNSPLVSEAKFGIASCYEELDQIDRAYVQYQEIEKTYPSPKVVQIKLIRIRERKAQRNR